VRGLRLGRLGGGVRRLLRLYLRLRVDLHGLAALLLLGRLAALLLLLLLQLRLRLLLAGLLLLDIGAGVLRGAGRQPGEGR
jgi:hypothetical protein